MISITKKFYSHIAYILLLLFFLFRTFRNTIYVKFHNYLLTEFLHIKIVDVLVKIRDKIKT